MMCLIICLFVTFLDTLAEDLHSLISSLKNTSPQRELTRE